MATAWAWLLMPQGLVAGSGFCNWHSQKRSLPAWAQSMDLLFLHLSPQWGWMATFAQLWSTSGYPFSRNCGWGYFCPPPNGVGIEVTASWPSTGFMQLLILIRTPERCCVGLAQCSVKSSQGKTHLLQEPNWGDEAMSGWAATTKEERKGCGSDYIPVFNDATFCLM